MVCWAHLTELLSNPSWEVQCLLDLPVGAEPQEHRAPAPGCRGGGDATDRRARRSAASGTYIAGEVALHGRTDRDDEVLDVG
jgi:hypothetical protein